MDVETSSATLLGGGGTAAEPAGGDPLGHEGAGAVGQGGEGGEPRLEQRTSGGEFAQVAEGAVERSFPLGKGREHVVAAGEHEAAGAVLEAEEAGKGLAEALENAVGLVEAEAGGLELPEIPPRGSSGEEQHEQGRTETRDDFSPDGNGGAARGGQRDMGGLDHRENPQANRVGGPVASAGVATQ